MTVKKKGMNQAQKAVYRRGEARTSKEEIAELLELSCSRDPEERLIAAEFLCPCHVRTRIPAVWEALFRMMQDEDKRVRHQAWHTIEDGGKPTEAESIATLERICAAETDPKVRAFAERTLDQVLGNRKRKELDALRVAHLRAVKPRGKCDFCGETNVLVSRDLNTLIPTGGLPRAANVCDACAQTFA